MRSAPYSNAQAETAELLARSWLEIGGFSERACRKAGKGSKNEKHDGPRCATEPKRLQPLVRAVLQARSDVDMNLVGSSVPIAV